MKRNFLVLPLVLVTLFSSCKKDDEKCENWTYNEVVQPKGNPACASFRESAYGLQKRFCGSELTGAEAGKSVLAKETFCYDLYTQFVKKD